MKVNTKDNPVLLVVLLLVLLGAVAFIVAELRARGKTSGVAQAASSPPPVTLAAGSTAAPESPIRGQILTARGGLTRDPFSRPAPKPVAAPPVLTPISSPLPPLRPMPLAPAPVLPSALAPPAALRPLMPLASPPTTGLGANDAKTTNESDAAEGLKVTAILGDETGRCANVENADGGPRTMRVGDRIGGWRVAVIRETELVLASKNAVRTVPLTTGPEMEKTDGTP